MNRINTEVNNITQISEIPNQNLDKILFKNSKSKILMRKEENISDDDEDGIINKANDYNLNVKEFEDKENRNPLNFTHNNYIKNKTTDTIHSYSIIDSKDSIMSVMPIHSSNKNLDETHKKYFV